MASSVAAAAAATRRPSLPISRSIDANRRQRFAKRLPRPPSQTARAPRPAPVVRQCARAPPGIRPPPKGGADPPPSGGGEPPVPREPQRSVGATFGGVGAFQKTGGPP